MGLVSFGVRVRAPRKPVLDGGSQHEAEASRLEGGQRWKKQGGYASDRGATVVAGSITDHERLIGRDTEATERDFEDAPVGFLDAVLERQDVLVDIRRQTMVLELWAKIEVDVTHDSDADISVAQTPKDLEDIWIEGVTFSIESSS